MPLMSGSNSVSSLPFKKLHAAGGNYINFQELPQILLSNNQKERASTGNHLFGEECPNLSETFLVGPGQDILSHSNAMQLNGFHYENSLFSSSLSETFGKLGLFSSDTHFDKSVDATGSDFVEGDPVESLKEIEAQTIGDLLPNDDDLLSGLIGDIERVVHPNNGDEDDLFCSGGGMELESDESLNCSKASDFVCGIPSNCQIGGLNSIYSSDLMNVKQTSRTLIVRNVRSNIEEAELKMLFEQFGVIRGLNTANKNRGFILVSYYDIRAARNAVRALQDRLLKQHKIEINYYNPKDNVSDQDRNNATIIISNIDSSVSNGDIHQIFGLYGEIKEIFHDPHFQNQRSIEFYDVRAADAAFSALNMSDISGMKIKVEPGCPGAGWQWNGISSRSSSLGNDVPSGTIAYGVNTSFGLDSGSSRSSSLQTLTNPFMDRKFPGISTTVPHSISSSIRVTMGANQCNQSFDELSHSLGQMNIDFRSTPTFHPHSLPESHNGLISGLPFNAVRAISSKTNIKSRIGDGIDSLQNRQGSGHINSHSFEQKEGKVISPIDGHHYIQSNPSTNFHQPPGSFIWQSPTIVNNIPARPLQLHGLPRGPSHMMSPFLPLHHHVGSAPALNPRGRCTTCAGDCMEAPSFYSGSLGNVAFSGSSQMHPFQVASHRMYPHDCRNCIDLSTCAHIGSLSPQQRSHILHGRNSLNSAASLFDAPVERIRSRRSDPSANQVDNKKQFELDINRIICGEDLRTTLMIKNIPNKYTSKMLLATIDEHQKGTYDFIYLPIDFKNKCNVGYAFINMNDPKHIIPFHQAFNGKKWEKFNSEKVASLAYARIQGKTALIAHFQNSSLMNEDKRCRPILFHSDGPKAGDQEAFPMGTHIRSRPGRFKTTSNEDPHQRSPPDSGNMDFPSLSNGTDSSPSFTGEPSFGTT